MTKTAAQRQANYRKRRPEAGDNGERRINTWVTTATSLALKRMARHHHVTQREILEDLILAADQQIIDTLGNYDSEQWIEYFRAQNQPLRSNASKAD